jgi:hypothetical protein
MRSFRGMITEFSPGRALTGSSLQATSAYTFQICFGIANEEITATITPSRVLLKHWQIMDSARKHNLPLSSIMPKATTLETLELKLRQLLADDAAKDYNRRALEILETLPDLADKSPEVDEHIVWADKILTSSMSDAI